MERDLYHNFEKRLKNSNWNLLHEDHIGPSQKVGWQGVGSEDDCSNRVQELLLQQQKWG